MYDMSQPNAKPGTCGKCKGSGVYQWGACVNGKMTPLTTRPGLTPRQQLMMDAFNLDAFRDAIEEEGHELTATEAARFAELKQKAEARPGLIDQAGNYVCWKCQQSGKQ